MTPDQAPKPESQVSLEDTGPVPESGGNSDITAEIPVLPQSAPDTSPSGDQTVPSEAASPTETMPEKDTEITPKDDDVSDGDFGMDADTSVADKINLSSTLPEEGIKMPDAFGDHQATANSVDTQQNAQEGQEQAAVVNSATSPNGTDSSRVSSDSPLMRVHEDITTKYPAKQTAPKGFWARLFGRNK